MQVLHDTPEAYMHITINSIPRLSSFLRECHAEVAGQQGTPDRHTITLADLLNS